MQKERERYKRMREKEKGSVRYIDGDRMRQREICDKWKM